MTLSVRIGVPVSTDACWFACQQMMTHVELELASTRVKLTVLPFVEPRNGSPPSPGSRPLPAILAVAGDEGGLQSLGSGSSLRTGSSIGTKGLLEGALRHQSQRRTVRRRIYIVMAAVMAVSAFAATATAYSTNKTFNSCTATHSAGAASGAWYASTTSSDVDCEYVDVYNSDLGSASDSTYPFYANVNDNSRPGDKHVDHAQCGPTTCSVPYVYFINWP